MTEDLNRLEEITFKVPDHSVFTKDRKFKDLDYNEKMYLSHLNLKGFGLEWHDSMIGQWRANTLVPYLNSRAYRPVSEDDEVHWPSMPYDWIYRSADGTFYNTFEEPYFCGQLGEYRTISFRRVDVTSLKTTKNNGKHHSESKMKKPEGFRV